jgi:hypothetical protein
MVDYPFLRSFAICMSFLVKHVFKYFPISFSGLFYYHTLRILYEFWMQVLYWICSLRAVFA